MFDEERMPPVPLELVKALDKRFPDACPLLDDTDRMIWFHAGQRAVVNFLLEIFERQSENILAPEK